MAIRAGELSGEGIKGESFEENMATRPIDDADG